MKHLSIDLNSLPGLDTQQGLFGSIAQSINASLDDRVLVVMTYLYEAS
ncbi:MAG: hypothetical protein ABGW87_02925 [Sphingomonadaceae bacterium]